jgi:putative intracellular protease/amidase
MTQKTVHLAVYEGLADWEAGLAVAQLRSGIHQRGPARHQVRTVGLTPEPVLTMGGLRVLPDLTVDQLSPADSAMLIIPGGDGWEGDGNAAFTASARAFLAAGVPVAAICGATAGLARAGLLDDRDHTGPAAVYLAATGYAGTARYREAAAVRDRGLITAGPTAPVDFAREIMAELGVWEPEVLDAWYRLFADSDPAAFAELAALAEAR